ncbi:SEC-C motif protein isoform X2 [Wolffia australiana]
MGSRRLSYSWRSNRFGGICSDVFSHSRSSSFFLSVFSASISSRHGRSLLTRGISSTSPLRDGWFDKVKGVFTGKKDADSSKQSFTLMDFASQMDTARKVGSLKQFVVGRCSETTISVEFEKQSSILRYLGSVDPTGENLQSTHKQDAAKHCNCTLTEVENTLARYLWAKDAQKKLEKLKEEGNPLPKSFSELQKMMGSTPLDLARGGAEKSGQLGRNSLCPCGSTKKYKKCCGKGKFAA